MALWGNKDLVYSDGTVDVNLSTKTVTGAVGVVTFTTAGISTGNVITVGAGATYGYAVVIGFTSTTISLASTEAFVSGLTTVSGSAYAISEEPLYTITDGVYVAPEVKLAGTPSLTANPVGYTTDIDAAVFGVDTDEAQAIGSGTTATSEQKKYSPAHAGWVGIMTYTDMHGNLRVKSEVFVAMGKDSEGNGGIQNDADGSILDDDTQFPDSI